MGSKGGGGGGGKKGGGSPQQPKINLDPHPAGTQMDVSNLVQYESSFLPTAESLGNWAANLATGGAAVPIGGWNTSDERYPGTAYVGAVGIPGITSQGTAGTPGGVSGGGVGPGGGGSGGFVSGGGGVSGGVAPSAGAGTFFGPSPTSGQYSHLQPVYNSQGNYIGYQTPGGQFYSSQSISADTLGVPAFALPPGVGGFGGGGGGGAAPGGQPTAGQQSGVGSALNTEWQNILNEEGVVPQISQIEQQTAQSGQNIAALQTGITGLQGSVNQEIAALQPTESGQLLPGQQAMIDTQVQSGKSQLDQQLSSMGLGPSTMGTELGTEIGLQGAATGGQLEQGNIQLLQGAQNLSATVQGLSANVQKLALGQQELSLGEQNAMFSQFQAIAQQAGGVQSQLYSEAMQGYGLLGQFTNSMLQGLGVNMQGYSAELNAEAAQASDMTSLEIAQLQSQEQQGQAMGGLFQGIGAILGAGGSSGIGAALGGLIAAF